MPVALFARYPQLARTMTAKRCELEIFTGQGARRQALRYAMQKYGHFREVQLEEQSETPRVR